MSCKRFRWNSIWFLPFILLLLVGCKKFANPAESANGYTWMPIGDTAFLAPDKTWLEGYGRRSTDGMIDSLALHALGPDVQPWGPEAQELMYPKQGGWGRLIEISVRLPDTNSTFHERFSNYPQSICGGEELVKEPSDLESYGFLRFRERSVLEGRTPPDRNVYYEHLVNGRVKYFTICHNDQGRTGATDSCNMHWPYSGKFEVTATFRREFMPHGVAIAGKIEQKLKEFEAAGQQRLLELKSK